MKHLLTLTLLCFGLLAQAQIPSYVPTNGLVGWWPFNGNANDESGNGNHGTVNGATLAADRFGNAGKAYSFDGVNDNILNTTFNYNFNQNEISISAWINSRNGDGSIVCKSGIGTPDGDFRFYFSDFVSSLILNGKEFYFSQNNANIYQRNTWNHVLVVLQANSANFFINGIYRYSITQTINFNSSKNNFLYFGTDPWGGVEFLDGLLDDIAIYNRALSAAEVQQLYLGACAKPSFTAQPQNKSVAQGQTTTFAVQVDSASRYQWQMNLGLGAGWTNIPTSALFSGDTTATLSVQGRNPLDGAQFRCIATSCNADTSNAATLTVTSSASAAAGSVAGVPGLINYQGSALDSAGKPLKNQTISLKLSVLDSSSSGAAVYVESHTAATNGSGHFAIQIGGGTALLGTFDSVGWSNGRNKYLKTELSQNGTWVNLGTSQLVSVPYALHAGSADRLTTNNYFNHFIGELYGGGIIFHLWKDSNQVEHGLIASLNDLSSGSIWSNVNQLVASSNGLPPQLNAADGEINTQLIINQAGHSVSAASLCKQYQGGGKNDWYLPAVWELRLLYNAAVSIEKILGTSGKLSFVDYWSSTEEYNNIAWSTSFSTGFSTGNQQKSNSFRVRAIRKF